MRKMIFFYTLLFLAIVSGVMLATAQGDEKVTIRHLPNDNVLLPCNCKGMNRTTGFKWQIKTKHSFCFLNQSSEPNKNCTRLIRTFQHDTIDNCSILLEKVTETDNGNYTCIFFKPVYVKKIFDLEVSSASSKKDTVSVPDSNNLKMYLTIITITVLLLFGCILIVLLKRRRKTMEPVNQDDTHP